MPITKQRADFIDEQAIYHMLTEAGKASRQAIEEILVKGRAMQGLTPQEVAVLLQTEDPELLDRLYTIAKEIKERIYGKRVVLFAPLYLSNACVNNCLYCAFRRDNTLLTRRTLTMEEIAAECRCIEAMGHKRIVIESGEHPGKTPISYICAAIDTIYKTFEGNGSIRRVNVNIAATTVEEYRLLKQAKIGTYTLFQETYHRETYHRMHPSGPKADYDWHTTAMDRAMEAGIDDVGLGVLFGQYDYKFEVVALFMHAQHLENKFGVGPHTISVPRIRKALGAPLNEPPYAVSDGDFQKIVAIIRVAVPYTGMILSTRERPEARDAFLSLGISQISAGSCTGVGEYGRRQEKQAGQHTEQFVTEDNRSLEEVVQSICQAGYIPSFCTACYRQGRTGDRFMALAKSGRIQDVCQPNALLTFKEYLLDYATPAARTVGEATIRAHLAEIRNEKVRALTVERLHRIEQGERDLYF